MDDDDVGAWRKATEGPVVGPAVQELANLFGRNIERPDFRAHFVRLFRAAIREEIGADLEK